MPSSRRSDALRTQRPQRGRRHLSNLLSFSNGFSGQPSGRGVPAHSLGSPRGVASGWSSRQASITPWGVCGGSLAPPRRVAIGAAALGRSCARTSGSAPCRAARGGGTSSGPPGLEGRRRAGQRRGAGREEGPTVRTGRQLAGAA